MSITNNKPRQRIWIWAFIGIAALAVIGLAVFFELPRLGHPTLPLIGHSEYVTDLAFSPDGRRLATAGDDNGNESRTSGPPRYRGVVQVWDRKTRRLEHTLVFPHSIGDNNRVAFAPDSRLVAGANDASVTVWNADTGLLLHNYPQPGRPCSALFFDEGGALRNCGLDANTAEVVKLWDPVTGQQVWQFANEADVTAVVVSPDRRTLAVSSFDPTWHQQVKLLDARTGRLRRVVAPPALPQMQAQAVGFSSDGRQIALASSEAVVVLDMGTGRILQTLAFPAQDAAFPNALAFSPDGTHLAVGTRGQAATLLEKLGENSHHFGTVTVCNLNTGARRTMPGYDGGAESLQYAPDGGTLWADSQRVWDMRGLK